jgi:hypothetical protein
VNELARVAVRPVLAVVLCQWSVRLANTPSWQILDIRELTFSNSSPSLFSTDDCSDLSAVTVWSNSGHLISNIQELAQRDLRRLEASSFDKLSFNVAFSDLKEASVARNSEASKSDTLPEN